MPNAKLITAMLLVACTTAPEVDAQCLGPRAKRETRLERQRALLARFEREQKSTLELRVMAYDGDRCGTGTFDLKEEARRLREWIDTSRFREILLRTPEKIEVFSWLRPDEGGPQTPWLRWYPRLVKASKRRRGKFDFSLSNIGEEVIAVPLFDAEQYKNGPDLLTPHLVEFVPISMFEPYFDQNDLDPTSLTILPPSLSRSSQLRMRYRFRKERLKDLASWSENHYMKIAPIIHDSKIVSIEVIREALSETGILYAGANKARAEGLVARLKDSIERTRDHEDALALRHDPSALTNVPFYAKLIENNWDPSIRLVAARRLAWYGEAASPATSVLMAAVRDQDVQVAIAAIDALGAVGVEAITAVPLLAGLRYTTHDDIQTHAQAALQLIRGDR